MHQLSLPSIPPSSQPSPIPSPELQATPSPSEDQPSLFPDQLTPDETRLCRWLLQQISTSMEKPDYLNDYVLNPGFIMLLSQSEIDTLNQALKKF